MALDDFDDEELLADLEDWVIGEQRRVVQLSIGELVDEFFKDTALTRLSSYCSCDFASIG
jgi:hypothetical protein